MRPLHTGFTLIELLVALAVVGLALALVSGLRLGAPAGVQVRGAANDIAAVLRAARGRAIAADRPVSVTVDLSANRLVLDDGRVRELPRTLRIELVAASAEVVSEGAGRIRFEPDGSSSGGRLTLTAGAAAAQVGIDWLTGRVAVRHAP